MKAVSTILAAIVFFGLTAALSSAQTQIYIAQNATGANSGADCANAHAAAWFNTASNWGSGTSQIGPGDTVHLCGTLTGALTVSASGSSGSPITVLFESGAKISLPYCPSSGCLNIAGRSYITVDGGTNGIIESNANGTSLPNRNVSANGIIADNTNTVEIRNLTIQNMYIRNSTTDHNASQPSPSAIGANGATKLSIHDNTIHDCLWCIWLPQMGGNYNVYNNNIYNMGHGIVLGLTSNSLTPAGFYIYGNHIHDTANWDSDNDQYHEAGLHFYGYNSGGTGTSSTSWIQDVYVYNNVFDGNWGNMCCITGHIYNEGNIKNEWIFNNVSLPNPGHSMNAFTLGAAGLYVLNNTIIGGATADNGHSNMGLDIQGSSITQNNNVITSSETLIYGNANGVSWTLLDYNLYANGGSGGADCFNWHQSAYINCSGFATTWRSYSGEGSHSAYQSSANLDGTGHPNSGSPAISFGMNLTSLCSGAANPLCQDAAGNPRPASGAWDAGAYLFGAVLARPAAPSGLTASVN